MVTPLQEQEGMSSSKELSCWSYENVAFYDWACVSAVREVWLRHNARYTIHSRRSSVQFTFFSVMSDSLQPHGLQHSRFPCPSPTPRACSNSCPSSQWCHPNISSSVSPSSLSNQRSAWVHDTSIALQIRGLQIYGPWATLDIQNILYLA